MLGANVMNYLDVKVPRLVALVSRLVHHLFRWIRQKIANYLNHFQNNPWRMAHHDCGTALSVPSIL